MGERYRRHGHSILTWQDLYYDGILDEENEWFCEETQSIILNENYSQDGWDDYEELYLEEYLGLWDDED